MVERLQAAVCLQQQTEIAEAEWFDQLVDSFDLQFGDWLYETLDLRRQLTRGSFNVTTQLLAKPVFRAQFSYLVSERRKQ